MGLPQWILNNMKNFLFVSQKRFNPDTGKFEKVKTPGAGQVSSHQTANNAVATVVSVAAGTRLNFSLFRVERDGGTVIVEVKFGAAVLFSVTVAGIQEIVLQGSTDKPVYSISNTTASAVLLTVETGNADTTGIVDVSYEVVSAIPTAPT